MRSVFGIFTVLFSVMLGAERGFAQSATTDPVGFVSVTCLGNSDSRVSFPVSRAPEFSGSVAGVSGAVLTISGNPGFTVSGYKFAAGVQTNTYYATFVSGAKEGMYYTIQDNSATTLTVDLNGDVLEGQVVAGDLIRIIPYWTLGTAFPGNSGITTTTSISGASSSLTRIFLPNHASAGINLAAASSFYYYSGTGFGGPGWRKAGGGITNIFDHQVILPDEFVILRQDGVATDLEAVPTGAVVLNEKRYLIGTLQANTPQDNHIALDVPVPLTLTQSNLFESGAFTGTASISGTSGDSLFVYDDAVAAKNKAASARYYYYTGTSSGGPGWRKAGGGIANLFNNAEVFQPGRGYVIRKAAEPVPQTKIWTFMPSYVTN